MLRDADSSSKRRTKIDRYLWQWRGRCDLDKSSLWVAVGQSTWTGLRAGGDDSEMARTGSSFQEICYNWKERNRLVAGDRSDVGGLFKRQFSLEEILA